MLILYLNENKIRILYKNPYVTLHKDWENLKRNSPWNVEANEWFEESPAVSVADKQQERTSLYWALIISVMKDKEKDAGKKY